jgi:predicted HTH domain antitoxin
VRDCGAKEWEGRPLRKEMIEITIPESLEEGFDAIPATGLYESAAEFISEAIKTLWVARKDLRLEVACRLYAQGEISIGKACEMAEVDIEHFKDVLASKSITRESSSTVEEIKSMATQALETSGRSRL